MARNPYFIDEPVVVSFSGGLSSGFMLYWIIQAFGGQLPDWVKIVFCNTGKEMEQSLMYVRDRR